MADPAYRPITPRTLGRNAYIPENDPEFVRRQQEPSSYDLFKQYVIQNAYNEALRATGSEARAMEAANSVSRKMFRTELIGSVVAPEAAIAGAGRAVNVAKGLFGREKAAEAASPLLLPAPRRNSMLPEERLPSASETPSVLRMGPDRVPSLANSQSLPRLSYDIPTIPSRGLPPARDVVSSPFDDIGRMAGEGGMADDAIMAARRMAQERVAAGEAAQARRVSDMESEGGSFVNEVLRKRALAAEEEAAYKARQFATADDEGMMAVRSPYASRQAAEEAAYQARIDDMMSEGGGGAISRTPPPGTRFTLGESSSSGVYRPDFTRPEGSRFGLPALRGSTDVATTGSPAAPASVAGGYDIPAILRKLGLAGAGVGAGAAAVNTARDMYGNNSAASVVSDLLQQVPAVTGGSPTADETAGIVAANELNSRPVDYGMSDAQYRFRNLPGYEGEGGPTVGSRASYGMSDAQYRLNDLPGYEGEGGPTVGSSATGSPAPARQKAAFRPAQQQAAASPASLALFEAYNKAVMRDDSGQSALFDRARKAKMEEEGLARGGVANGSNRGASGGKDAAIHKALEIIHHMMVNR